MKYNKKKKDRKIYEGQFFYINENISIIEYNNKYNHVESIKVRISTYDIYKPYHEDIVKFIITKTHSNNVKVKIVGISNRKTNKFVTKVVSIDNNTYILKGIDRKRPLDISASKNNANNAQINQLVVVKIYEWGVKNSLPKGKITKILGNKGSHNAEMHAIMFKFALPTHFSEVIENQAKNIKETLDDSELNIRRDMRKTTTFTIDPADAKDYDDAISISYVNDNHVQVGVHIADVTHYVKENDPIDKEARERATSVYLVDRTIPMLPEKLSNNLCSLVPNKDRYAFSVIWDINIHTSKVEKKWLGKTIIHSDHRFTYESAQKVLDDKNGLFYTELNTLNNLAKVLRSHRINSGAIDFHTQEVRFTLDKQGVPKGVSIKPILDTNHLIEELMLLANKHVANFIVKQDKELPFIYRIHGLPNDEKLNMLRDFASQFGYRLDFKDNVKIELNKFMNEIIGKNEQNILEKMTLRCMDKAVYSTKEDGHFGLGFKHYSHFTSPIRRYPDLIAHRLLQKYLNGETQEIKKSSLLLDKTCQHSSIKEKNAVEAERASIKYKQVEYLSMQKQDIFKGFISGVIEKGLFVELPEYYCEGFVQIGDIKGDRYTFDKKFIRLVGNSYGKQYKLSQAVYVKVKRINLDFRQVDFFIVKKPH